MKQVAVTDHDLAALLDDLKRQRRDLEKNLDDTGRSQKTTQDLIDRIVEMKIRAAKLEETEAAKKKGR